MGTNSQRNHRDLPKINLIVLAIVLIVGALGWGYRDLWLLPGAPKTHDGQSHMVRMAQYYLALKEGQWPPRIAGNLNNQFGYPVFVFNYPLANILAYPLIAIGLEIEITYKVIVIGGLISAAWGIWWWQSFNKKHHPLTLALMVLAYTTNPYVMNLVFVRGALGELMSLSLLPWMLGLLDLVTENEKKQAYWVGVAGVVGSLYLLSHNIMVYLTLPVILGYGLKRLLGNFKAWPQLIITGLIAGLLASWFWVPALLEKGATVLDQAKVNQDYQAHFLTPTQWFTGAFSNGYSYPGPVDGMGYFLGLAQWWVVITALMILFKQRSRKLLLYLGILAFVLFLTNEVTASLYPLFWGLNYIQFPWRWLFVVQFLVIGLISLMSQHNKAQGWVGVALIILLMQMKFTAGSFEQINLEDKEYFYATETTSTLDENMPKEFNKNVNYRLKDEVFKDQLVVAVEEGIKIKQIDLWSGTHHRYQVIATSGGRLVERAAYFPGYKVWVDGQETAIDFQLSEYPGLITFWVRPGEHQVITQLTQLTKPRIWGLLMTVAGFIIASIYIAYDQWLKPRKRQVS